MTSSPEAGIERGGGGGGAIARMLASGREAPGVGPPDREERVGSEPRARRSGGGDGACERVFAFAFGGLISFAAARAPAAPSPAVPAVASAPSPAVPSARSLVPSAVASRRGTPRFVDPGGTSRPVASGTPRPVASGTPRPLATRVPGGSDEAVGDGWAARVFGDAGIVDGRYRPLRALAGDSRLEPGAPPGPRSVVGVAASGLLVWLALALVVGGGERSRRTSAWVPVVLLAATVGRFAGESGFAAAPAAGAPGGAGLLAVALVAAVARRVAAGVAAWWAGPAVFLALALAPEVVVLIPPLWLAAGVPGAAGLGGPAAGGALYLLVRRVATEFAGPPAVPAVAAAVTAAVRGAGATVVAPVSRSGPGVVAPALDLGSAVLVVVAGGLAYAGFMRGASDAGRRRLRLVASAAAAGFLAAWSPDAATPGDPAPAIAALWSAAALGAAWIGPGGPGSGLRAAAWLLVVAVAGSGSGSRVGVSPPPTPRFASPTPGTPRPSSGTPALVPSAPGEVAPPQAVAFHEWRAPPDPSPPSPPPKVSPAVRFEDAVAALDRADWRAARRALAGVGPGDVDAFRYHQARAVAAGGTGDRAEAVAQTRACFEVAPARTELEITRFLSPYFYDRRFTRDGVAYLEAFRDLLADRWWYHANLATLYERLGDEPAAARHRARDAELRRGGEKAR